MKNTEILIVEMFDNIDPKQISAVLVKHHGPFTCGNDADESVCNSVVLKEIELIAWTIESRGAKNPNGQEFPKKTW